MICVDDTVPLSTVSHALYPVEAHLKTPLLMKLLKSIDTESVLVFTRTKHRATRLARQMIQAGFAAASLQGDLPQNKRQAALSGFRSGACQILVATDVAARGIDVSRISHVINYDMPDTVEAYTHRIGRTGRAARTGDAFTFVTREERALVWPIEKVLGEPLEKRTLREFDYSLPAPAVRSGDDRPRRTAGKPGSAAPRKSSASSRTLAGFPGLHTGSGLRPGKKTASR
jgi:ATP-dependent RNA helicase RhlE